MKKIIVILLVYVACSSQATAQCDSFSMKWQWEVPFTIPNQCMTAQPDRYGKDYVYVAAKELGVKIYNTSSSTPVEVKSFTVTNLGSLQPMSISQNGNYIYVALGNTFNNNEKSGMAIIDVTNPDNATLKSVWKYSQNGGAGIVKAEGNYAYLGAMQNGLLILDITDKSNVQLVSTFIPSIAFPNPSNPDPAKYNARGMQVKNDIVYLCYDAGGLRIINTVNKSNPVETGRYSNPKLMNKPRAYNNIIIDDSLAYITVDYCGLEVLNIKDTAHITQIGWWDPWNCTSASNNWFNSGGHTNEIAFDSATKTLFMSTGKSEINVVSVANPHQPDSCGKYGNPANKQGTWGIGLYQDKIFASYIYVPLGIPFLSNWSGFKMIKWHKPTLAAVSTIESNTTEAIFPNPSSGRFVYQYGGLRNKSIDVYIYSINGSLLYTKKCVADAQGAIEIESLNNPQGLYICKVLSYDFVKSFIVQFY